MDVGRERIDHRPLAVPKRAILYINGATYDVLVTRFARGRVQVEIPFIGAATIKFGRRTLRTGSRVYVSPANVELVVDGDENLPEPLAPP